MILSDLFSYILTAMFLYMTILHTQFKKKVPKLKRRLFISLMLFCFSLHAEPLKLALTTIPSVLEHGKADAPYNQLINAVLKQIELDVQADFIPSARANFLLDEEKIDCIFPIIPTQTRRLPTNRSVPINGIRAYLFSVPPNKFTTLTQLEDKVVAHLRGYIFGDLIKTNKTIFFFPVSSPHAALGVLKKGRAVAYLDYIPDLKFVLPSSEFAQLSYDVNSPVISTNDVMECRITPSAEVFLTEVNKSIKEFRANGKLKHFLGDYYVPLL